jgi:hypothetical protein
MKYNEDSSEEFKGEDKYERAARFVRKFAKKSEKYRKPHLDLALAARELYESWSAQSKSVVGRANLKLPYGFTIIETQLPQLTEAFLKEKPLFKFVGREPQDVIWEPSLNDFHSMQLDQAKFPQKFIIFAKSVLVDGTAIMKVPYRFEERATTKKVPAYDPITGEATLQEIDSIQTIFDGPDLENVSLVDFFPDWRVKNPGDIVSMRGCIHRTYKTFNELKRSGRYKNLKELELSLNTKGCEAWGLPYWSDEATRDFDRSNDNDDEVKRDELIELWEYWGEFPINEKGETEEYLITVANGDVAIRCTDNPYRDKFKPFIASVNVPRLEEFYGIPELIAIRGLIKEATTLRNARLDQVNLAVNRMFIVDRNAGIQANSLYSRPGGVIYSNDIQGIRLLEAPEVSPNSAKEIQDLQMEIQNATGMAAAAPAIGQLARTFGRSATGASLVQSMATSRVGMKARLISHLFVQELQKIMFMTNGQFVTDEIWLRVSDPMLAEQNPFQMLSPEAFKGTFDFEFVSTFEESGEVEFQKLQQFLGLAQAAEQTQPGTIKWGPIFEQLGRSLLGRKVRNFVRSDEERMMLQQQNLMMEQAANAQVGAMAMQPNAQPGMPSRMG